MMTIEMKKRAAAIARLALCSVLSLWGMQHQTAMAEEGDRPVIKVPRAGGRELFQSCVLCHKYDGRGGPSEGGYGADLRVTTLTREQLIHIITYGRQVKGMPPFKDLLEESKIETLADFILVDLRLKQ